MSTSLRELLGLPEERQWTSIAETARMLGIS
jgi:hypothetical protein